jgi:hypothetical protein
MRISGHGQTSGGYIGPRSRRTVAKRATTALQTNILTWLTAVAASCRNKVTKVGSMFRRAVAAGALHLRARRAMVARYVRRSLVRGTTVEPVVGLS